MKKITLLFLSSLFLLTSSLGYSQTTETFDPVAGSWVSNAGEPMTTVDVIDATVDFATYGKVGRMITKADGQPWQNAILTKTDFKIDISTTKTITADVYYVGGAIDILGKLAGGVEVNGAHPGSGWSSVTWDFTGLTGEYNTISFFPLRDGTGWIGADGNTEVREVWIDNITTQKGSVIPAPAADPATGATDPIARATADYMSFYNGIASPSGDQYVNETGVTFDSFGAGGSGIVGDVVLGDGNTAKKYSYHNYSGIGGGSYDVSSKTKLHIDVYFDEAPAEFQLKLESPNGVGGNQVKIVKIAPASGVWLSYDIDLSFFTAADLTKLKWIIPVTPGTAKNMYFDNIYFYGTAAAPSCTDGIKNGDETGVDCGGTCDACPEIKLPLDFSDASQLFTYIGAGDGGSVVLEDGKMRFNGNGQAYDQAYLDLTSTFSLIDNDNNTFTVTMDPLGVPDGEERTHLIRASFAGGSAAGTQITGKSVGSGSQEVTFNFGVSGAEAWSQIILFMDFGQQGTGSDYNGIVTDYLISSITLGADPAVPQVPPTVAAPTAPARNAADVISIYSKTTETTSVYADIAGIDFPYWGGNSGNVTPEVFENDLALKFPAFTYQGVQFPETDLSGMTMLHLDIWAQTQGVGLDLIATGGASKRVNISSNNGVWSSVDIALSDFTDLNLSKIFQMKFYGLNGANADGTLDIYLDNIYFYTGSPLNIDKNNILNVNLYPSPAQNELTISAKNTIQNASIYNVLGRKVQSYTVNATSKKLDISSLSTGIYILKYTVDNVVGSMKFIKE
jgi:hypothetical protein